MTQSWIPSLNITKAWANRTLEMRYNAGLTGRTCGKSGHPFELIIELKNIEKEERRRRRLTDAGADSLIYAEDVWVLAHDEGYQESSLMRLAEYSKGWKIDEEMTLSELCGKMEWVFRKYTSLFFF